MCMGFDQKAWDEMFARSARILAAAVEADRAVARAAERVRAEDAGTPVAVPGSRIRVEVV